MDLAIRIASALSTWSKGSAGKTDPAVDEFVRIVSETRKPESLDADLIRLARQVAGPWARRVELVRDGDRKGRAAEVDRRGATTSITTIPLRCGGRNRGILRIEIDGRRPLGPDRLRALNAMAVLAAAADPRPIAAVDERPHPTHDATTGLPNATFFDAFLSFTLAQAERRREPLSLLYVGVDRLAAIRELHGPELAGEALRKVGRAISGTLRTSDLIARLDGGRLACLLPTADASNAAMIAESLRLAVEEAGGAGPDMPVLTISIGAATYPAQAVDVASLCSAAAAALADARSLGRNRVAFAPSMSLRDDSPIRLLTHCH